MKRHLILTLMLGAVLAVLGGRALAADDDWKLCLKPYSLTFKPVGMKFNQALLEAKKLGITAIEARPGDIIGGGVEGTMAYQKMDKATRKKVLAMCRKAGVKIAGYGMAAAKDKTEAKQLFEFCKAMGVEYIVIEPKPELVEYLDTLANEYKIAIAIHNHRQPSLYWSPETVLEVCQGRSKMVGACADTGHWERSMLNPLESLKKMEGRIIMLHFKDLNEKGNKEAYDVAWGTGVCNVPAMLAELRRQGFKGYFSIEYEHGPSVMESLPKIVEAFNKYKGMSEAELRAAAK